MNQKTHDLTSHACDQVAAIIKRTLVLCDTDEERIHLMTGIACGVMAMTTGGVMAGEGHHGPPSCTNIADFSQQVANLLRGVAEKHEGGT